MTDPERRPITVEHDLKLDADQVLDLLVETNDEFIAATRYCLASASYARKLAEYARFVIVRSGGRLAGVAAYYANDEMRSMYVPYFVVKSEFSGRGVGRSMLEVLLDAGRRCGFRTCGVQTLITNKSAIALYSSLGFKVKETRGRKYYMEVVL